MKLSVRLKSKRQRINTVTFYLCDILTPLVDVVFEHIDQIFGSYIWSICLKTTPTNST